MTAKAWTVEQKAVAGNKALEMVLLSEWPIHQR